jgi:hypothetical protein
VWEGISWSRRNDKKSQLGIDIRGENGAIYADDHGYTIFDTKLKALENETLSRGDAEHLQNFLDAIRGEASPNMDIEEGHKSTMFCHLGNIAYRTGQPLAVDSSNGRILDNTAAEAMWTREYRDGWFPTA